MAEDQKCCCIIIANENYFESRKSAERLLQNGLDKRNLAVLDSYGNEHIQSWADKEQIRYCALQEEGCIYGINQLISEMEGDILLVSAGVWVLPYGVKRMQQVLGEEEKIVVAAAGEILKDNYQVAVECAQQQREMVDWKIAFAIGNASVLLLKRDFFDSVGFNERFDSMGVFLQDLYLECVCSGNMAVTVAGAIAYSEKGRMLADMGTAMVESDYAVLKAKWGSNYFCLVPNWDVVNLVEKTEDAITVLEIGCDCGGNLLGVRSRCENAKLYGVEINPAAARIASGICQVTVGDIEEKALDFPDKFDYIIFADVLEHLRNPEETLRYCRTLLKENGKVLACIPNLMNCMVMKELLNGYFTYQDEGLLDRTHIHFFTYNEMVLTFRRAGYELDNVLSRVNRVFTQEDNAFIESLLKLSESTERFMYETFQFVVSAVLKKE